MKAKHINRIKRNMRVFYVMESYGLFGDFTGWGAMYKIHPKEVLARTHEEAVYRYQRRWQRPEVIPSKDQIEASKTFAKYLVHKEGDAPRKAKYYRRNY